MVTRAVARFWAYPTRVSHDPVSSAAPEEVTPVKNLRRVAVCDIAGWTLPSDRYASWPRTAGRPLTDKRSLEAPRPETHPIRRNTTTMRRPDTPRLHNPERIRSAALSTRDRRNQTNALLLALLLRRSVILARGGG